MFLSQFGKILKTEPIWEDIKEQKNISPSGNWEELKFDKKANLILKI